MGKYILSCNCIFDFFVLDDLLVKLFPKKFDKLHDQAVNKIAQEEKLDEI